METNAMTLMTFRPLLAAGIFASAVAMPLCAADAAAPVLPAWLAGTWCSDANGAHGVEHWITPAGDTMLGMSRTVIDGRKTQFEFMRIALIDGTPTFFAQPNGVPPTAFKRVDGGADWIRFDQPAHDFPQRVEYRRSGSALHAEISGPGKDDQTMTITFEFAECRE